MSLLLRSLRFSTIKASLYTYVLVHYGRKLHALIHRMKHEYMHIGYVRTMFPISIAETKPHDSLNGKLPRAFNVIKLIGFKLGAWSSFWINHARNQHRRLLGWIEYNEVICDLTRINAHPPVLSLESNDRWRRHSVSCVALRHRDVWQAPWQAPWQASWQAAWHTRDAIYETRQDWIQLPMLIYGSLHSLLLVKNIERYPNN